MKKSIKALIIFILVILLSVPVYAYWTYTLNTKVTIAFSDNVDLYVTGIPEPVIEAVPPLIEDVPLNTEGDTLDPITDSFNAPVVEKTDNGVGSSEDNTETKETGTETDDNNDDLSEINPDKPVEETNIETESSENNDKEKLEESAAETGDKQDIHGDDED